MGELHRRHVLIEASLQDVWDVVSSPQTHPGWWPELVTVDAPPGEVHEGDTYTRVERRFGFLDQVDSLWVVDRMDHLKEAHFRCTVSGTYARFGLTPAQEDTFVEAEVGQLPPNLRWRMAAPMFGLMYGRWLRDLLEGLPEVVERERSGASAPR
jgi:hypothetical protein